MCRFAATGSSAWVRVPFRRARRSSIRAEAPAAGMIDDQVHCREPGRTHKATLATESLAVICGGVTSSEMPNTTPPSDRSRRARRETPDRRSTCHVNYGFYLGATNTNLEEIRRVGSADRAESKPPRGCRPATCRRRSGHTGGNLREGAAARCDPPPSTADDPAGGGPRARALGWKPCRSPRYPHIRSAEACDKWSALAVGLARCHGTRGWMCCTDARSASSSYSTRARPRASE